jgi:ribosomal protein S18 acetylase RimI-like enzyme
MIEAKDIFVRPATQGDVDSLIGLSAAMAWETEGRRLETTRLREGVLAVLDSPHRGYFIVAEARANGQQRIVGQLMVTFEWSDWRNAVFWWIQSVYVDPAWRRQGVYRSMHDRIVAQAKADPTSCGIRLYVAQNNRMAQWVYQQVGLSPSGYIVYEQDFVLGPQSSPTGEDKQREGQ